MMNNVCHRERRPVGRSVAISRLKIWIATSSAFGRLLAMTMICIVSGTCSWAQTINIKPVDVLKTIFQSSQEIVSEKHTLSADQKLILLKSLGTPVTKDEWTFYVAKTAGQVDGYAMIDHELGKMEPITFMTAFNKDGSVKAVEILVYREPYGSEVHEKKFVKQYEGKKNTDVLRVGQDIQNMTGATISSRSVTIGVKRDLAIWNIFYGKK